MKKQQACPALGNEALTLKRKGMSFPKSGAMVPRAQGLAAIQLARVCPSVPSTTAAPLGCVPILQAGGCIRQAQGGLSSGLQQLLRLNVPRPTPSVPSILTALMGHCPSCVQKESYIAACSCCLHCLVDECEAGCMAARMPQEARSCQGAAY